MKAIGKIAAHCVWGKGAGADLKTLTAVVGSFGRAVMAIDDCI